MTLARDAEARVVEVVPHPLPYFTLVLDVAADSGSVTDSGVALDVGCSANRGLAVRSASSPSTHW